MFLCGLVKTAAHLIPRNPVYPNQSEDDFKSAEVFPEKVCHIAKQSPTHGFSNNRTYNNLQTEPHNT